MDDFKKKIITRQLLLVVGLLVVCCAILLSRYYVKAAPISENLRSFIEGFQVGIVIGLFGALSYYMIRNITAMRSQERLKKLYISETDERKLFIQRQSGSVGMNIVMYGLATGTVVAGNINDMVFFTLLFALLFVSLVRVSLKLYFRKKY